jgi:hypothetical protein
MEDSGIAGNLCIQNGNGGKPTVIEPSTIGEDLIIKTGFRKTRSLTDDIVLTLVSVGGRITITTGAGTDSITIDDSSFQGTVLLDAGGATTRLR